MRQAPEINRSSHPCDVAADGESGQALLEFALCLPVLLLLVFGICTFGVAFANYLVLENAVNIGARQLAISRAQTTDPCGTASATVSAAAPTLAGSNLTFTYTINGMPYAGVTCPSATVNMVHGATAKLTVKYPCSLSSYDWSFGACTLAATTAELVQ